MVYVRICELFPILKKKTLNIFSYARMNPDYFITSFSYLLTISNITLINIQICKGLPHVDCIMFLSIKIKTKELIKQFNTEQSRAGESGVEVCRSLLSLVKGGV